LYNCTIFNAPKTKEHALPEATNNFLSDIHDDAYEAPYLERRLTAESLVNAAGRGGESLDGRWNFGVDWYDSCKRAKWFAAADRDADGRPTPVDYDWEAWDRLAVPACWNLERPELLYFEGSGIYTRTFRYLPRTPGERSFLYFEGAAYRTTVFLNGRCLGSHDGASTPFNAEITDAVRADNRIIVVVESRRRADRVPAENTDWFNYGGLYRSVRLLRLPPAFIADWFLRLAPDGGGLALDAEIAAPPSGAPAEGILRLSIAELGLAADLPVRSGRAAGRVAAAPKLWSPESPKLYGVELTFLPTAAPGAAAAPVAATAPGAAATTAADSVADRIGFRDIRVRGRDILLNGRPIFLKGISVHEDRFDLGKTTDEATIRAALAHLKELHGNFLRLAHYPHDARFARLADEAGVLLWEEVPVYWAIAFADPAAYADAANQLAELVKRDRNRASVAVWSVGNENADSDARLGFMSRLAALARELDGSRPVSAACLIDHVNLRIADRLAAHLDLIGVNEYYGWYDPDFGKLPRILANSDPAKPVVITEFGGDARSGERGTVDDLWTEDKQAELYRRQTAVIAACPYVKGMTPWILYDFRCPRRLNRYQEGFNRKGLVAADRTTKKLAFEVLAAFYAGFEA
jgi:beta-glucuronidase